MLNKGRCARFLIWRMSIREVGDWFAKLSCLQRWSAENTKIDFT